MSEHHPGRIGPIPEEVLAIHAGLCCDVSALQLKWDTYLGLLATPEVTELLSDTAPAFFQVIAESLRNDIVQSICRLSDPSRSLGPDAASLATLVGRCSDVPRAEDLLTAFQAACGPVRRYRHRQLGHRDPTARIEPRADLLPGVDRARVDEILRLAGGLLRTISARCAASEPDLRPVTDGGVAELIGRVKAVQHRRDG